MRRAFADTLLQMARDNDRVIFLTGDLGFQVFEAFEREFPRRYVNAGVAEAQLVDCAAGMAMEGWRPVIYSIASFLTGRAFEQIRLSLGYHNLPVIVVGAGGGYTYAQSGVSHHAKEDLALMSLIPNMTVVNPGDPDEVATLLPQLIRLSGPSYLRIGKFGEPRVPAEAAITLGRGRMIRDGHRIAFVTTGGALVQATEAADRLAEDGIAAAVFHFHTVKPLDSALLYDLAGNFETLIVIEDHGIQGGLRNAVAQILATGAAQSRLVGVGPDDEIVLGNPTAGEIMARFGITADALVATGRSHWNRLSQGNPSHVRI